MSTIITQYAPDAHLHPDESEDDEAIPLCRTCGAPVGIFPELDLGWRHFRGDAPPPAPTRPSTPATLPRSPGTSPMRPRKSLHRASPQQGEYCRWQA